MNTDSWENEIQEGWVGITKKEYQKLIKPSPTKEQQIERAEGEKQWRISEAAVAIATLQDAVDLGMATSEEVSRLEEWRKYRVLLSRVDTSIASDIDWPQKPI
ncbi:tail fiber assembly protein [Morganella morganii]